MTKNLISQQGAVLVFTLLLLLMITLLGVNMVQQNRTQFMMAENSQSQTTNFSEAENMLRSAEIYIASQRYVTWPIPTPLPADCFDGTGKPQACSTYDCQTSGGVFQQLMPGDLGGGAVIPDLPLPSATDSNVEIVKTVCVASDPLVGLQYQDCSDPNSTFCAYDAGSDGNPNPTAPASRSNNPCHTELYTIRATIIDAANNERVVESQYAVRCDN